MKSKIPANHHKSCYPSLFDSLRDYSDNDRDYDLTAARDNIDVLSGNERATFLTALLPYADRQILYAGFSVVDTNTRSDDETSMLATRKSPKTFEVPHTNVCTIQPQQVGRAVGRGCGCARAS